MIKPIMNISRWGRLVDSIRFPVVRDDLPCEIVYPGAGRVFEILLRA